MPFLPFESIVLRICLGTWGPLRAGLVQLHGRDASRVPFTRRKAFYVPHRGLIGTVQLDQPALIILRMCVAFPVSIGAGDTIMAASCVVGGAGATASVRCRRGIRTGRPKVGPSSSAATVSLAFTLTSDARIAFFRYPFTSACWEERPTEGGERKKRRKRWRQSAGGLRMTALVGGDAATHKVPRRLLLRVVSVACGVQFGWALQLSLLTPYVQELGIPHQWASLVWLCGPLSGLIVQPLVGHLNDRYASPLGRRRPYIAGGAAVIAASVLPIGYSADIGHADLADGGTRYRAIAVYLLGFRLLYVGNSTAQGPCRALLADLTGKDHRYIRVAIAYFSLFMALGNVLGFATGSYSRWFSIFPFTVNTACSINCANLKSAFLLDVVLLMITTTVSVLSAKEIPLSSASGVMDCAGEAQVQLNDGHEAFLWELVGSCRYLMLPIWTVLIVTALTWIGWFPFILFDTDWMGWEMYKGNPNEGQNYQTGERMGAIGLMFKFHCCRLYFSGFGKTLQEVGCWLDLGNCQHFMFLCFLAMLIISSLAKNVAYPEGGLPPDGVVIAALVTYTILYAMISACIEPLGLGQGLAMGILNLAIVIP
ncbi:Sucrose transport protein [Musa troglodytarum]|uniref:Sucrose transport protein n=2 Tax=Musa troglodytarum TaxID=320322 RepID=A0A9E7KYI5_9LILI|nr:Sucrose transport protein [Musa troglodytarum]URE34101.1 Sucrose transport protein [Musa troglodytarum]